MVLSDNEKYEISLRLNQAYYLTGEISQRIVEFSSRHRKELFPYLRRVVIEAIFEEHLQSFFKVEIAKVSSNNYSYIELHKLNRMLTIHHSSDNQRLPKQCTFRNSYAEDHNYDLFKPKDLNLENTLSKTYSYIVHSGRESLESVHIVIPDKSNQRAVLSESLAIVDYEPREEDVEQIVNHIKEYKLKETVKENEA